MKKIYTTILAALLSASVTLAEEGSFSFVRNGEVVPSGSTVTVTEPEIENYGVFKVWKMESGLFLHNNTNGSLSVKIEAKGVDNYSEIMVCPFESCKSWVGDEVPFPDAFSMTAGQTADMMTHIENMDFTGAATCPIPKASMKFKAINAANANDFAEVTLVFDATGENSIHAVQVTDKKAEVFNLCGKKVADTTQGLPVGVYIVRQGNKSKKITVR